MIAVAVQVSASSYVPVKSTPQGQRGQLKMPVTVAAPPPVPPRSALRLSVNPGGDHHASSGHQPPTTSPFHFRPGMPRDMQSHVTRTYRQPPLLVRSPQISAI